MRRIARWPRPEARPEPVAVELRHGGVLYIDPRDPLISQPIGASGEWEPHVTAALMRLLTPETLFVDVGANLGYFTILGARVAKRVVAFEPAPANVQLLLQSIEENRLANAEVWPVALSDQMGIVGLYLDPESTNAGLNGPATIRMMAHPGDAVMAAVEHDGPCVLKIDVEGHETHVLRGLERFLEARRPTVILEFNPTAGGELSFVFKRFERIGVILSAEVGEGVRWASSPTDVVEEVRRRNDALGIEHAHVDLLAELPN